MSVLAEIEVLEDATSGIEDCWRDRMMTYLHDEIREAGRLRFKDRDAWATFVAHAGPAWQKLNDDGHVLWGDEAAGLQGADLIVTSSEDPRALSSSKNVTPLAEVACSDAFRRAERRASVPIGGAIDTRDHVWNTRLLPLLPRVPDSRVVIFDRYALARDGGRKGAYEGLGWITEKLLNVTPKIQFDVIACGRPSWTAPGKDKHLRHKDHCDFETLSGREDVAGFLDLWLDDERRSPRETDSPRVTLSLIDESAVAHIVHDRILFLASSYSDEQEPIEIEGRFVALGRGLAAFQENKDDRVQWTTFQRGRIGATQADSPETEIFATWLTELLFPRTSCPVLRLEWLKDRWRCVVRRKGEEDEQLADYLSGAWVQV